MELNINQEPASQAETKRCRRCGQHKPVSEFHQSTKSADGLQSYCKTCKTELARNSSSARRQKFANGLNPDLEPFQPRELIAELRARGYHGELKFVQVIKV